MRLKELRKAIKMTQQALADKIGVSRSAVAMWETSANEPDNEMLIKLSKLFNCSVDYLLGKTEDRVDDRLLDEVNEMSPDTLARYGNLLDASAVPNVAPIRIPVLGTIPAGVPLEAIEDVLDWEELPAAMARGGKEYFGLKVSGDSMLPDYRDGDVLILRKQDACESGQDCAVMVNSDDATFKRVRISEKGITLMPLNPAYEPLFYSNQEVSELPVRIIGVVVELRRKVQRGHY